MSHEEQVKRFEALLRLKQGASNLSQPGAAAAADGPPAADGVGVTASGGGVADAVIEFTRKVSRVGSSNRTTRRKERKLRGVSSKSRFQILLDPYLFQAFRLISPKFLAGSS